MAAMRCRRKSSHCRSNRSTSSDRDRQRASLPRFVERQLAVRTRQIRVGERESMRDVVHRTATPIIESRVTMPASSSSLESSVPSGRIGSTR